MSGRRRHAKLTPFARRLTPIEVAQHWFRRGTDYAQQMHLDHPGFPDPGPDGLYLLSQVEAFFDRLHGKLQPFLVPDEEAEEMLRAARGHR